MPSSCNQSVFTSRFTAARLVNTLMVVTLMVVTNPVSAVGLPSITEAFPNRYDDDKYHNRVLTDFAFTPEFKLAWGADGMPTQGAVLYCRVTQEEKVLSFGSMDAFDEETGELVTEGSCGQDADVGPELSKITSSGMSTVLLELSYETDFLDSTSQELRVRAIPGGLTVLPPIIAVVLAITTQDVLASLFCGIWMAAFLIHSYDPFRGFLRAIDTYCLDAFADEGHIFVILFSWFLSGLTGLIQRGGGAQGLANSILRFATSRRSTMLVCFLCGIAIFFDDYANTLIVGSTFRPIMDTMLISREKLAFLVDATSAPIASISPISSWIGFELSLIEQAYNNILDGGGDLSTWETSPFLVFVKTIPGRFYPMAMLALQLMLILTQRDFGPMFSAERRALREKKVYADNANSEQVKIDEDLEAKSGLPARWWNAVLPISLVVFFVLLGLVLTGVDSVDADPEVSSNIENIFGSGDPFASLLWATFAVSLFTWGLFRLQYFEGERMMTIFNRSDGARPLMKYKEIQDTWIEGIKQLVSTTLVLILAWGIGDSMKALGTDTYIASGVSDSVDAKGIPVLVFILSACIAVSTGTSWGTMSIMFPVATKAAFAAAPDDEDIMLSTIASILSGSVFGDHVTPISDTTILSSLATRCDLMHHVRTQLPYAMLVGLISIITGDLMSGYVYPTWAGLLVTVAVTLVVGFFLSARPDSESGGVDPVNAVLSIFSRAIPSFVRKSPNAHVPLKDPSSSAYLAEPQVSEYFEYEPTGSTSVSLKPPEDAWPALQAMRTPPPPPAQPTPAKAEAPASPPFTYSPDRPAADSNVVTAV